MDWCYKLRVQYPKAKLKFRLKRYRANKYGHGQNFSVQKHIKGCCWRNIGYFVTENKAVAFLEDCIDINTEEFLKKEFCNFGHQCR